MTDVHTQQLNSSLVGFHNTRFGGNVDLPTQLFSLGT